MSSNERRREARYQRRKAKREERKYRLYDEYDNFDKLTTFNALHNANLMARRGVGWKTSVQKYQMNILLQYAKMRSLLLNGKNVSKGFVEFYFRERGKERHIRSIHYEERVCQRGLCDCILVPMLSKSVIYDNYACLKGRGADFALNRLEEMLHKYYRKNGNSNDGWVLQYDFSSYFDSIPHDVLYEMIDKEFSDKRIVALLKQLIHPFGFPFAEGNWRYSEKHNDDTEYNGKSLGLGSQVSQIVAVTFPNSIDHYFKDQLGVKYYGRYMDDGFAIFRTKEEAQSAKKKLIELSAKIGLEISNRKTRIAKLSQKFTFLKVRFTLTDTGKVVRQVCKESVKSEKNKLRKLKEKMDVGEVSIPEIIQCYASWKGYAVRRRANRTVYLIDRYFTKTFGVNAPEVKIKLRRNNYG